MTISTITRQNHGKGLKRKINTMKLWKINTMKLWKITSIALIATCFFGTANASIMHWESNYGTLSNLSDEDDDNELFGLGFDFTFYGATYNEVYGSSNGSLFFNDEEDYQIGSDIEGDYGPMIAAFNADLNPEEDGNIYTNTLGASGDMRFVMTWLEVIDYEEEFYNSFQAVLFQDGSIRLNYLKLNGSGDNEGNDVIGLSQGDGTHFNYFTAADGDDDGIYPNGKSLLYTWDAVSENYNLSVGPLTSVTDVPEPSTLAIFALGMIGLASRRFKKQS